MATEREHTYFYILIIALFGAGLVLLILKQIDYFNGEQPVDYSLPSVRIHKKVATSIPSDILLLGWKVYRNDEYGFEFKYPKEWKDPVAAGLNVAMGCPVIKMGGAGACPVSVHVFLLSDPYIKGLLDNLKDKKFTTVNGVKEITYTDTDEIFGSSTYSSFFGSKNLVEFEDFQQNYKKDGIFENITASFKFIK